MTMNIRSIKSILEPKPVVEGAGVRLVRAFGYYEIPRFDPFLLFDDFRNERPEDYIKGFPWHPHRGIETITYMLEGYAEHGDSMGNQGTIGPGDVQWMTAGSGIIHQEMPKPGPGGKMHGFQLWANLPASHKMMKPRYQDVPASEIPLLKLENGVEMRIICGEVNGTCGPVRDIVIDPEYLDITLPENTGYEHPVKTGYTAIAYVIGGTGFTGGDDGYAIENRALIHYGDGDRVRWKAGPGSLRLLFFSGKPLNEPIAWGGPIVMNTREELNLAFEEFRSGRFIK